MAVYTRYVLTVTVETPAERKPQLVECLARLEADLHGHEFHHVTVAPIADAPSPPAPVRPGTKPRHKK